jgi:hypothetical protein
MAAPKVQIDNSKLLQRMKRYEEVAGKEIGGSLRRAGRRLAIDLAYSTPPYGLNKDSQTLGEKSVQNDIVRVARPMNAIKTKHASSGKSFREWVNGFMTNNLKLKREILAACSGKDAAKLTTLLKNAGGFSLLVVEQSFTKSIHDSTRNAYGKIRKGWKSKTIIADSNGMQNYIKHKQDLVGLTKAAWISCIAKINADVQNQMAGVPAWVKRHIGKVPSAVVDGADSVAPKITLTNKLPWADKALRESDYKEALRISREKFYKSMGTEIRAALKKAQEGSK